MRQLSAPVKYKKKVLDALRGFEERKSWDDVGKLNYLSSLSDDEFLRRWLWIVLIVGCPLGFAALPLMISVFQVFLPPVVAQTAWLISKLVMGGLLCLLLFAVYKSITWRDRS